MERLYPLGTRAAGPFRGLKVGCLRLHSPRKVRIIRGHLQPFLTRQHIPRPASSSAKLFSMTAQELKAKRIINRIPARLIAPRASFQRQPAVGYREGYVSATEGELARINLVLEGLIAARTELRQLLNGSSGQHLAERLLIPRRVGCHPVVWRERR